uniref:Membrane protein n=1 Tax=Thermosporothrix sp. COM3 TaxID=2490863 RepID=A0A455SDS7_9CHLR|nr:membrane protein [Thermosporothrix sp. COM3]
MFSLHWLDLFGTIVFAISGALTAGRKRLDLFGVLMIAAVTAVGGGTVRDVLLSRYPIFWFMDNTYLWLSVAAGIATMLYTRFFRPPRTSLVIADALGLSTLTVINASIATSYGLSPVILVIMTAFSSVAGGLIRDILCAEIPMILQRDIYITAVCAGAIVYLVLRHLGLHEILYNTITMITVMGLRVAAIYWDWHLPRYYVEEPQIRRPRG